MRLRLTFPSLPNLALLLATCLSLLPLSGRAQRLGDEVILSRLGDPVEVEIALEDWQGFDISQLRAGNGNAGQYELFGLEYQPMLDSLSFALVGPNLAGEVKVLISSREPVSEPFLELLLVLNWPSGSTLRDYTLLFDPPRVAPVPAVTTDVVLSEEPAPAVADTLQAELPIAAPVNVGQPVVPPRVPVQTGQPDVRTQAAIVVEAANDDVSTTRLLSTDALNMERRQYQVRNGDTLWVIARQFQPAGATENLYQFLISLHDLNREAFINGNISLLQADARLLVPTARDVGSINPATAQALFEERWADGTRIATGAASAPPAEFMALNEPAAEAVAEPVLTPPELPRGAELPVSPENSGLLTAANTSVVATPAAHIEPPVEVLPVAAARVQAEPSRVPQGLLAPSANPYLQQVTESAIAIQQLLASREQRLAQVEEQLLAMRIQMQEAQIATLQLNAKLQQAVQLRETQREENLRNAAFLGTLVAGLSVALVLALRHVFTLQRQMRAVRTRSAATPARRRGITQTSGFPVQQQAEVAEMEEITLKNAAPPQQPGLNNEHNLDIVPDIDISAQVPTDLSAVEPVSHVEEPDPAPRSVT